MKDQDQPNKTLQDILSNRGLNGGFGDKRIRRSRDFKFYGVTQARTGSPEMSLAFKIIKSNNEQLVISYHDISTPINYDGKSIIEFSISTMRFAIEGVGMETLMDYLAEHRLMWIKEPENSEELFYHGEDDEDNVIINSIVIKTLH